MTTPRRSVVAAALLVATAGVLFGGAALWASFNRQVPATCAVQPGDPLPAMRFSTGSDTTATGSLAGKPALLLFTSPECPVCMVETPAWRRIAESRGDTLAFWEITVRRTAINKAQVPPRTMLDDRSEFAGTLKGSRIPMAILVDARGIVRECFVGRRTDAIKAKSLERLLEPQP